MVTNALLVSLSIGYVAGVTNIDNLIDASGGYPGDWLYDDFAYDALGGAFDNDLNTWYEGVPESQLDGTTTCSLCGGLIHGWYYNSPGMDNQVYRISRDFICNSLATVTYEMNIFWCTNQLTQEFYIDEIVGFSGGGRYTFVSGDGTQIGTNADVGAPDCEIDDPLYTRTITSSFEVEADYIFTISIGSRPQADATGWNGFRIKCDQIITDPPSSSPTEPSSQPSEYPTESPTPAPTDNPTPGPTNSPSEEPTTPLPTDDPTTVSPTIDPTRIPTVYPTYDLTENPTESPTKSDISRSTTSAIESTIESTIETTIETTIECDPDPFECANGKVIRQYYSEDDDECVYPRCFTPSPVKSDTAEPTQDPTVDVGTNGNQKRTLSIFVAVMILYACL